MANSQQLPFFAHNGTVKAWCFTGNSTTKTLNPHQNTFDAVNFVDGYNLRLDTVSQTGIAATTTDVTTGALRFAFITPMSDTKYKVFVHHSVQGGAYGADIGYAHVLNSSVYPKTTTGFWVRCGIPIDAPNNTGAGGSSTNRVYPYTFGPGSVARWITNLRVVVL